MGTDLTARKLWSRQDDAAYRAAVAAAQPAPEDRDLVLSDMRHEIEESVRKALKRLEVR